MDQQQVQIKVKADDQTMKGYYANVMMAAHAPEEFVLDFMFINQQVGQLVARVITSPGHMKRIVAALQDNLKRYESQFGDIKVAEEPERPIGFDTK